MSLFLVDRAGYRGDVASVGGWHDFVSAAGGLDPDVSRFLESGYSDDPAGLAKRLLTLPLENESASQVRFHLIAAMDGAQGTVIVTDGTQDLEEPRAAAFDPEQERDDHGKWVSQGGEQGIVYHGTPRERLDSILKNGIQAYEDRSTGKTHAGITGKVAYVSTSLKEAQQFALDRPETVHGVVLEVHVPPGETLIQSPEKPTILARDQTIPPEWIKGVYARVNAKGEFQPLRTRAERARGKPIVPTSWRKIRSLAAATGRVVYAVVELVDEAPRGLMGRIHDLASLAIGMMRVGAFNPDQARDDHGRWTAGYGDFESKALDNLDKSSRTAGGVSDTSSAPDKKPLDLAGQALADKTRENVKDGLRYVWDNRNTTLQDGDQALNFIETLGQKVNAGLTTAPLYREHETKNNPVPPSEVKAEARKFAAELSDRLRQGADPVATAAWVEHQFDGRIHPFTDGMGRTTKLLSAYVLLHAGRDLPTYGDRKTYYEHINRPVASFTDYYRSLYPGSHSRHAESRDIVDLGLRTLEAIERRLEYSPDEARDDHGRWTHGGAFVSDYVPPGSKLDAKGLDKLHTALSEIDKLIHDKEIGPEVWAVLSAFTPGGLKQSIRDIEVGHYDQISQIYGKPMKLNADKNTKLFDALKRVQELLDDPVIGSEVQRAITAKLKTAEFNPDQARDDHGRWTDGGAGSGEERDPGTKFEPIAEADVRVMAQAMGVDPDKAAAHADQVRANAITDAERTHANAIAIGDLAGDLSLAGGDSKARFTDSNGRYTPERQAVHEKIIADILAAHAGEYGHLPATGLEHPTVTFLAGMPGAGKSTAVQNMDKSNALTVDPDFIKTFLPEYRGANAGEVARESGDIGDKLMQLAYAQRMSVIVDGTAKTSGPAQRASGDIDDGLLGKIAAFKDNGFKTDVRFVDVTVKQSVARAVDRFVENLRKYQQSGFSGEKVPRWVELNFIKKTMADEKYGNKSRRSFELAKQYAPLDSYTHVNGWTGQVIDKKG